MTGKDLIIWMEQKFNTTVTSTLKSKSRILKKNSYLGHFQAVITVMQSLHEAALQELLEAAAGSEGKWHKWLIS